MPGSFGRRAWRLRTGFGWHTLRRWRFPALCCWLGWGLGWVGRCCRLAWRLGRVGWRLGWVRWRLGWVRGGFAGCTGWLCLVRWCLPEFLRMQFAPALSGPPPRLPALAFALALPARRAHAKSPARNVKTFFFVHVTALKLALLQPWSSFGFRSRRLTWRGVALGNYILSTSTVVRQLIKSHQVTRPSHYDSGFKVEALSCFGLSSRV